MMRSAGQPDPTGATVEVNGEPVPLRGAPQRRLLSILRDDCGLTGARPGCEIGRCGACVVWLDGEPVNACLVMAWQLPGRRVRTIEAAADEPPSRTVRDALARFGGVQCGYCSPGLVMTLAWLYARTPAPPLAEVFDAVSGHLCRCTGYAGIRRAIEHLFGRPEPAGLGSPEPAAVPVPRSTGSPR